MLRIATLLLVLACSVGSLLSASSGSAERELPGKADSGSKVDYVLQPGDLLKVQVFQEEDLTREQRISQEYTISLPLINIVNLFGKTKRQAEDLIRDLYARDYLAKPQVTVLVTEYVPRRVFVSGAVTTPGVVLFHQEQGLILVDAISRAGGFNRLADRKRVTLKRMKPDGSPETWTINVEEVMKAESTNETWPLQPNDVITVPEKII